MHSSRTKTVAVKIMLQNSTLTKTIFVLVALGNVIFFSTSRFVQYNPFSDRDNLKEILTQLKRYAPPVKNHDDIKRILLITTFRSGSNFLGDLLKQSNLQTFYFAAPLRSLVRASRIDEKLFFKTNFLIRNLFSCQFESIRWFFNHTRENLHVIEKNQFITTFCGRNPKNFTQCNEIPISKEFCRRSHVQLVKLTRLQLKDALKLDVPSGTQFVYLQRDPRAIWNSRKEQDWCDQTTCLNLTAFCRERNEDLRILQNLTKNRIVVVRHEDLALNPFNESRRLFSALGLNFTERVTSFLQLNTRDASKTKDFFSTRRNSTATVFRWRTQLKRDEIIQIEKLCQFTIQNSGYEFMTQD